MNIRHIFMTIAAIMLASAALADSSSVTSKKYVDDFMAGYQNKIPGSGADKLMIYDDTDGIGAKQIVSSLGDDTSAANVPNVGAVKTGLDGKQDTITGTAGYVMTGTGTPGEVGERAIYSASTNYPDALVTAESVNTGVINAVNSSLRRVNANGDPDNNGTLWEINTDLFALNVPFPLPPGYTEVNGITNDANTSVITGIQPTVDDVEWELRIKPSMDSWYILQARRGGQAIWGISGSQTGASILLGWNGNQSLLLSSISRNPTHTYYIKATVKNGIATLYVKDETDNTEDTKTTTYTFDAANLPASPFYLYANGNPQYVASGNTVYMVRIKVGGVMVMDYVPAVDSNNNVGFWDKVSGTFKTASSGTLIAGPAVAN